MKITRRTFGELTMRSLAVAPFAAPFAAAFQSAAPAKDWTLEVSQLTRGPKQHFFGYIGHVQNTPWSIIPPALVRAPGSAALLCRKVITPPPSSSIRSPAVCPRP